ncbi:hypothetical protein CPC08DRAFT_754334 [Agrocybe pediades]|nr:hypothetical protein CPC08DRAFT_754334 [Agrocybe pediades]
MSEEPNEVGRNETYRTPLAPTPISARISRKSDILKSFQLTNIWVTNSGRRQRWDTDQPGENQRDRSLRAHQVRIYTTKIPVQNAEIIWRGFSFDLSSIRTFSDLSPPPSLFAIRVMTTKDLGIAEVKQDAFVCDASVFSTLYLPASSNLRSNLNLGKQGSDNVGSSFSIQSVNLKQASVTAKRLNAWKSVETTSLEYQYGAGGDEHPSTIRSSDLLY